MCGPGKFSPSPSVSVHVDQDNGHAILNLPLGDSMTRVQLKGFQEDVDRICSVSESRLVVFGKAHGSYSINIVDAKDGSVIDWFMLVCPVMSPDQHWIVGRDFIAPQTELSQSEEYLLYDLSKDATHNRSPGLTRYTAGAVGEVVYPKVAGNTPFEHIGSPSAQTHVARSSTFYWSSDSRSLAFADSVQAELSIILVRLDKDGFSTFVHPVTVSEACLESPETPADTAPLTVPKIEVGSSTKRDDLIEVTFAAAPTSPKCTPKTLTLLQSRDFQPAELEIHQVPARTQSVPKK
jgi:hypothetical protein